ncbi:MAG TPA: UDP-N-acetylmuramoyl-L-alanine--D-glutamate ligase [Bryobacteraceae bacterium]|nr:UDP-N-acetylmuramoyl-L-alanine--D-glutamate ligase [Bryobacteraceae bacterium]
MARDQNIKGLKVLVAGLGKSGLAAIHLLVGKGAHAYGTDSRAIGDLEGVGPALQAMGVPFHPLSAETFQGYDLIVLSPGVPRDLPELQAVSTRVIGEVELASWFLEGPILGITGANGKTTTTALAGHVLERCGIPCQVGGNIGLPPTAMVGASRRDQWNVLELSSFQLETIETFRAQIGVCLNITPDHLDRHHTFEAYAAAKGRLFETQQASDWAVLNADDGPTAAMAQGLRSQPVWFSLQHPVERGLWLNGGNIYSDGAPLMPASEIPLRGRHNIENVMAAAGAARLAGATLEGIRAAVRTFPGVEHRIEFVREVRGVPYYNDSKATNVDATLKSIEAFEGGLWIILGGKDKGGDYAPLGAALHQKAKAALLIGAAAEKIASQIAGTVVLVRCGTLEAAVNYASSRAVAGDTVLLAPACASFDQFKNYEERGKLFKTFVGKIV